LGCSLRNRSTVNTSRLFHAAHNAEFSGSADVTKFLRIAEAAREDFYETIAKFDSGDRRAKAMLPIQTNEPRAYLRQADQVYSVWENTWGILAEGGYKRPVQRAFRNWGYAIEYSTYVD
jgi:hypothetical protein